MGLALSLSRVRRWQLRWGATDGEVPADLAGDELLPHADRSTTRAVTIAASPHEVWPWLAQMGQGRGGLYSYDFLENLIGCDIHSTRVIVEDWQHVAVGDPFRLHPDIALQVVLVEPDRALVVQGGVPIGDTAPPYNSTWAFILRELDDGNTRLVIRERYWFSRPWASLIVEPVTMISFVMTRKMLHGIRSRVQRQRSGEDNAGVASAPEASATEVLTPGVYLYWLPLGAGAQVVRLSGEAFEAIAARLQHRLRRGLYHSALQVVTRHGRFVVEMTPVPDLHGQDRGVVAEGAVGTKWARPFRLLRYEIHRWPDGVIADLVSAIDSPQPLSGDAAIAQRLLELVPVIPTPVWGRDELHTGEMWNSNSVTAWLLSLAAIDTALIHPPPNGRAPGWDAGLAVAARTKSASTIDPGPEDGRLVS